MDPLDCYNDSVLFHQKLEIHFCLTDVTPTLDNPSAITMSHSMQGMTLCLH